MNNNSIFSINIRSKIWYKIILILYWMKKHSEFHSVLNLMLSTELTVTWWVLIIVVINKYQIRECMISFESISYLLSISDSEKWGCWVYISFFYSFVFKPELLVGIFNDIYLIFNVFINSFYLYGVKISRFLKITNLDGFNFTFQENQLIKI